MGTQGHCLRAIRPGLPELRHGLGPHPSNAPVFSLPGDRMFQSTDIVQGFQRPAIMHAYMEKALASIAHEGWMPLAAAMLGTVGKPPMWATIGLRPVVGTTLDLKVAPIPLSERERLLLLSCWQRWEHAGMPGSALSEWLVDVDVEQGPEGSSSPTHVLKSFSVVEAVQLYQESHLDTLEVFGENSPYSAEVSLLVIRVCTHEYPLASLLALQFLAATGHLTSKFPYQQWINAVRWHGDSKVAVVLRTVDQWRDALVLLGTLENIVVEATSPQGVVVWTSSQTEHTALPVLSHFSLW